MQAKNRGSNQRDLDNIIRELSKSILEGKNDTEDVLDAFLQVYKDGFRHYYSMFFPLINELDETPGCELACLTENLENILKYIVADDGATSKYSSLAKPLTKLCDHLNLEISRLEYYNRNENIIRQIQTQSDNLSSQIAEATHDLYDARQQVKSIHTELITVLSIFAAVIITFFGGLNFVSSAIASLHKVHIYKSVLIVSITGFILYNTIFTLMYVVSRVINRNIYARCKTESCTCNNKCIAINRIRKRLPYIFWVNFLILLIAAITCIIWLYVNADI